MEIDVCVDQDFGCTEVKGMEPYELLSDALSIFTELLLNVWLQSGKNPIPYVKQSNFSLLLFLIVSVSKILMYLKANLNTSAGIISHPGNQTGMENSFAHNFKVKINLQWKFPLYKILQFKNIISGQNNLN